MSRISQSSYALALKKFKKNFLGVLCFWFIVLCGFIALFAYVLAPDNSANANRMQLPIHSKKPGFKVLMLHIPDTSQHQRQSFLHFFIYGNTDNFTEVPISDFKVSGEELRVTQYPKTTTNPIVKTYPFSLWQHHATSMDEVTNKFIKTRTFYFGTDRYGRDLLSRMIIGARISFTVGFISVFISLLVGITVGAVGGYYGGYTDRLTMFLINVFWSIPTLLLVIVITLALGKGFWQIFVAVGLSMWVEVARVVRGQVLTLKQEQYIEASRVLGFSDLRIILKHILPNAAAPIIVIAAANFAAAVLIESGLSFLGIGTQPPAVSWGSMVKDHYPYILVGKAYLTIIPGLAIMAIVMAFMTIGNVLRDVFEIKT